MPGALFVKGTGMPEEQQNLFSGEELAAQTSDPAARIEALRREIEHNSYLYYALDAPAISDGAFDSLMHELRALEAKHPELIDPSSPTQRVGGYVGEQFAPIQHERRMYSLDDAMDAGELDEWLGRVEDFFGDMDFKVGGTKKGITAIQMDLKIQGLTPEMVKEALEKTHKARNYIIDEIILKAIPEVRPELSPYAPKMLSTQIPVDKIREVIGSGGKVIQKICAECEVKMDVEEDGHVFISGLDLAKCQRALDIVDTIVNDPEPGSYYNGRVTRLMDFGAFVEIAPGKEGLVHISRLDVKRTEKVTDVVNVDDEVLVKVLEIDDKGRLNLSRRDALIEVEGLTPENEISDAPRRPRRDDRRGSNGFRPNNNRPRN